MRECWEGVGREGYQEKMRENLGSLSEKNVKTSFTHPPKSSIVFPTDFLKNKKRMSESWLLPQWHS